jgi:hypothetical protein
MICWCRVIDMTNNTICAKTGYTEISCQVFGKCNCPLSQDPSIQVSDLNETHVNHKVKISGRTVMVLKKVTQRKGESKKTLLDVIVEDGKTATIQVTPETKVKVLEECLI